MRAGWARSVLDVQQDAAARLVAVNVFWLNPELSSCPCTAMVIYPAGPSWSKWNRSLPRFIARNIFLSLSHRINLPSSWTRVEDDNKDGICRMFLSLLACGSLRSTDWWALSRSVFMSFLIREKWFETGMQLLGFQQHALLPPPPPHFFIRGTKQMVVVSAAAAATRLLKPWLSTF